MPVESTGKAETGNWKLENGKWKMGVRWVTIFQFPISHFPASRLTLHRANCYIRMRLWQDLEASEEWQTF
jgi:hypothetical protein